MKDSKICLIFKVSSSVCLCITLSKESDLSYMFGKLVTAGNNAPLLPLMKASPYLFLSCPLTYSSVCSKAMFI